MDSEYRSKQTPSARILLIDDEPLILRSLKRALTGYRIDVASNGRDALELLRSGRKYDIIFCDLVMPEMDGVDIYRHIKAEQPDLAQKIVFMTGGLFTDRVSSFFMEVNNPKIDKPFDIADIRQQVISLLKEG